MKFIFGPVISRRFGTSLGIDLSPDTKQCNFDCLYCELEPSTTTNNYKNPSRPEEIVVQLQQALKEHPHTDVITITANGEPTLYPYIDELILQIDLIKGKKETLILTNSTTLRNLKIHDTLLKLDQVKLSLDAVTPDVFKKIDRPHKDININILIKNIISFSHEYKGKLYIEILFVKNINDSLNEIKALNEVLKNIRCERIDLGTVDRPPAYKIEAVSYKQLHEISHNFSPELPIHIASRKIIDTEPSSYTENEIINTLDKRPLTQDDVDLLFDQKSKERLQKLIKTEKITVKQLSDLSFFIPNKNLHRKRKK